MLQSSKTPKENIPNVMEHEIKLTVRIVVRRKRRTTVISVPRRCLRRRVLEPEGLGPAPAIVAVLWLSSFDLQRSV